MFKFRIYMDFNKEERWLNTMAKQGWQLVGASFGYQFAKTEPEDANIKIDYRIFKRKEDYIDYCIMFEDSGWMHIAGSINSGNQYFKRVREDGNEDIFSDQASKAGRYKRLASMNLVFLISYLPIIMALIMTQALPVSSILNPKRWYLTPGLWEMEGIKFWRAFLFETPFALFRGGAWVFYLIMIMLFIFLIYKAKVLYKESYKNKSN